MPASAVTTIKNGNIAIRIDSEMWLAMAQPSSRLKRRNASATTRRHVRTGCKAGGLCGACRLHQIHHSKPLAYLFSGSLGFFVGINDVAGFLVRRIHDILVAHAPPGFEVR